MIARNSALLAALALVASLSACGSSPSSQVGQQSVLDKVTVGVIPIVDVAPIYLGQKRGFFKDRGIDLDLQTEQGGAAVVPAVLSGQYQFGFSNAVSVILARAQGAPVKVVSNGANARGDDSAGDFSGLVVKDPAITRPRDLEGKRVATDTLRNIVDTSVKALVKQDGGDPAAVEFVEMAFPDMVPALDRGRVDAIFIVEPFLSAARAKEWRVIGSYADVDSDLCVAFYFTSESFAAANPQLVARFREAINQSLEYAESHPEEVRKILASYTQIDEDTRERMALPAWPAEVSDQSVQRLVELMVEYGLIRPEKQSSLWPQLQPSFPPAGDSTVR